MKRYCAPRGSHGGGRAGKCPLMSERNCTSCACNWKKIETNERLEEMRRLLGMSEQYVDQTPGREGINGLQHALRTAALGETQGTHMDSAFIGLVHDLARPLNDVHHGEIVAEIVRDRVSEEAYHILRTHGQFQASIVHDTEMPFRAESWFEIAAQLAGFEVRSFQNDYDGPEMTLDEADELLADYLA